MPHDFYSTLLRNHNYLGCDFHVNSDRVKFGRSHFLTAVKRIKHYFNYFLVMIQMITMMMIVIL